MFKKLLIIVVVLFVFSGLSSITVAKDSEDFVYGRQLMTKQELVEHRAKMHSMKTRQEREAYRQKHHERMKKRAQEKGVVLPERPMMREKGMMHKDGAGMRRGMGGKSGM